MRVAATDYDGTLCINDIITPEVLASIRRWREAGNVFGLVTGRDLSMAMHEVKRWDIPLDYLVGCSGAIAYDADGTRLFASSIPDDLVEPVLRHPASEKSAHCGVCSNGEINLHIRHDSWFPTLGLPFKPTTFEEALAVRDVQQISFSYATSGEGEANTRALNEAFGTKGVRAHQNKWCVDITCDGVDKAKGLLKLLELKGWPEEGLLAIGDGENDIPMIQRFGGFTVQGASNAVKAEARAVYPTVGAMLDAAMTA